MSQNADINLEFILAEVNCTYWWKQLNKETKWNPKEQIFLSINNGIEH